MAVSPKDICPVQLSQDLPNPSLLHGWNHWLSRMSWRRGRVQSGSQQKRYLPPKCPPLPMTLSQVPWNLEARWIRCWQHVETKCWTHLVHLAGFSGSSLDSRLRAPKGVPEQPLFSLKSDQGCRDWDGEWVLDVLLVDLVLVYLVLSWEPRSKHRPKLEGHKMTQA
jgi:hypothetical protein